MSIGKKITEFIKETGLKPSECEYNTWRDLKNKETGEKEGAIRIVVPKDDGIARIEMECRECGHKQYQEKEFNSFEKPDTGRKTSFDVICEECEFKEKVRRLKDEQKREKRRRKRKMREENK